MHDGLHTQLKYTKNNHLTSIMALKIKKIPQINIIFNGKTILRIVIGQVHRRFYGRKFVLRRRVSGATYNHKTDDLPPEMTIFSTVILIQMVSNCFHLSKHTTQYPNLKVFGDVKPSTSQSEATFHNCIGLAIVYRRMYYLIFFTYPIRRCVIFLSALEFYFKKCKHKSHCSFG